MTGRVIPFFELSRDDFGQVRAAALVSGFDEASRANAQGGPSDAVVHGDREVVVAVHIPEQERSGMFEAQ